MSFFRLSRRSYNFLLLALVACQAQATPTPILATPTLAFPTPKVRLDVEP